MTNPTSIPSFKPFHILEQLPLFPWLSPSSRVSPFLNIANVIKITGQIPSQGAVFTHGNTLSNNGDEVSQKPTYLSNNQPDPAVKETFMQNSLSPQTLINIDPSVRGSVNQSPDDLASSDLRLNANANREKVIPINGVGADSPAQEDHGLTALSGEIQFLTHQLSDFKAQLRVAKEEIRSLHQMDQRTYDQMSDRMSQFEHRHKQAEIQRSQLRHAQDQQLERRLQGFIEEVVKTALHNTIERLGLARVRGAAISEPARQPSTYSVPKRESTGIYR